MESAWDAKVPGIGCQLHVIERLEDAAMRVAHGPTVSPEEGVWLILDSVSWLSAPLKDKYQATLSGILYFVLFICPH